MSKTFEKALFVLKRGEVLSDPAVSGLRYRCRASGTYAEWRFKDRDGRWSSLPLGKLTQPAKPGPDGIWRVEPGGHSLAKFRRMAGDASERLAKGLSPRVEPEASGGMTLRQALALHEKRLRNAKRSPRTVDWYRETIERYLDDWLSTPLASISRPMARQRHERITKRGTYAANGAMRALRAVWNTAMREDETLGPCPTVAVAWHKEERRDAAIPLADLPVWFSEVMGCGNAVRRDYYLLACWSGLRRETVSAIHSSHIDLDARTLFIPEPKGGSDRAFTLPLSDFLCEVISRRLAGNPAYWSNLNHWRERKGKAPLKPSGYLFPSYSASGHISEPKANGGDAFTVEFSVHGLRNTFISACAAAGISDYHTKLLANHAVPKNDVTGGYVSSDVDMLRPSQERVSEWLCWACRAWSPLVHGH